MEVTIYHNPSCSTSRNTLALIREKGIEPKIVEYLKTPPSKTKLKQLIADAGLTVREAMRSKQAEYVEQNLDNPSLTDDQLLDAMVPTPILLNRPIEETPLGVRLCRPVESVLEILPKK